METQRSKPTLIYTSDSSELKVAEKNSHVLQCFQKLVVSQSSWLEALQTHPCEVAVIRVSDSSKKQLLTSLQQGLFEQTDFIFLSDGHPNPLLDQMMHNGAGYHFRDPIDIGAIEDCLTDIYEEFQESRQQSSRPKTSNLDQFGLLAGSSRIMRKLYRTIRKVAKTPVNVLITGESGTGKELVANTTHLFSDFRDGPYVAINCGAISPELIDSELFGHVKGAFTGALKAHQGVFEQAENGTLFLDEVGEMPLEHQVKLLRVLESSEYKPVGSAVTKQANVRVIAATNRNLEDAVANGEFREDLYYRLAQFPISVPALRNRSGDVEGLAKHFLAYINAEQDAHRTLSEAALKKLLAHSWPGNVRELKHTIERACILSDTQIEDSHIQLESSPCAEQYGVCVPIGVPLEEIEKRAIVGTLRENGGNKTETAEQLGVSVKTLYNKLEKYQQE